MKRTLFQALRKQTAKIFGYAKIVVSAIFFYEKGGENRNAISRRWWCKTYCFLRSHVDFRSKTGEPYENMRTAD